MSYGRADAVAFPRLFEETVQDVGRDPRGWCTQTVADATVAGTALYTVPAATAAILGVAFDGRALSLEQIDTLTMRARDWRDITGDPIAYTFEDENDRIVRVFPIPQRVATLDFLLSERRGDTFPRDTPDRLDLPLALLTLTREYQRESDHRDGPFAERCTAIANSVLEALT
jgi:hypothetical protein